MLTPVFVQGQTQRIAKLQKELVSANDAQQKVSVLIALFNESRSMSLENLLSYIEMAEKLTKPNTPEYFITKVNLGLYLLRSGKGAEAILELNKLLEELPTDDSQFFNVYMQALHARGVAYVRNNRVKDAIQDGFTILKNADVENSDIWRARSYLLLGYSYMELLKYNVAIEYLNKCLVLTTNDSVIAANIYAYSNIASCYNNIGKMDSAFKYIEQAIKYGHQFENLSSLSNALNIRADMYINLHKTELATKDLEEALEYRKQAGDFIFAVSDMAQLSQFYASIGQTAKGINLAKAGIEMTHNKKMLAKQIYLMDALAENYRVAGLKNEYEQVLVNIISLKDSLYQINSASDIAAIESKYQLQKKENIIIRQESQLAKSRYMTYSIVALLTFIFIVFGLMYRNTQLVRQRKIERQLIEQQLMAEQNLNRAMEVERKRIAADLHDKLGAYAAAITNQVKLLKDKSVLNSFDSDNIEESANSMVSQLSDTIWVLKNNELTLTGLFDRLKLWMQKLMKSYPDISYYFNENIEKEYYLTPVNALHLFYILTECVNNALKHSECTQLEVSFNSSDMVEITVSDNGKGIISEPVKGNGIEHIKQRASEIKWGVNWKNIQPHGTEIILRNTTNEVYEV